MALEVELIKQPYEVSFTGNPMPYSFAITPYTDTEKAQDIRLIIKVELEQSFGSGIYTVIKTQSFPPDSNGAINFDVQSILDPYLEYYMPKLSLAKPVQAFNQRKRFRINYILQKDGSVVSTATSTALYAVKGGMAYDLWHPSEFFSSAIVTDKRPLHFVASGEKVYADDVRYLFWCYQYNDNAAQTVVFSITLDDNSTVDVTLTTTVIVGKWGISCVPIGFVQMGLNIAVPVGRTAVKYTVTVFAGLTEIVSAIEFKLDQRNFYNTSSLIYRNSVGGLETIRLRGQIDFEADYTRQDAQRTVPPAYFKNMLLMHQVTTSAHEETPKYKGDTSFISKAAADKLRDIFFSPQIYEITDSKLYPAVLNVKTTKFYANRENLIAIQVDWQRAYVNEFYTPKGSMPSTRSCPALEKFVVKQTSKNKLQIMYAAPAPYDRVQVEVIISGVTQTFQYTGNAQSISQIFTNPLSPPATASITVRGRVLCDEDSNPVDAGAWTTLTPTIYSDAAPIANSDTYNIAQGYSSGVTLSGSVLANDYDPDGDAIAVVPASGATTGGGNYSIDGSGIVTYTPPSSSYIGADTFTYELEQSSTPTGITATVTINVGAVGSGVYAKIVFRNQSSYTYYAYGEVWVDFFSDPAGITPIDVSSLSLTLHTRLVEFTQDPTSGSTGSTTTDTDFSPTGTKIQIYSGLLNYQYNDGSFPYDDIDQLTFTILAGTGYTPI